MRQQHQHQQQQQRQWSGNILELSFGDAPRPIVLRRYPLKCLQLLRIGFMFQTILFGFAGAEKEAENERGDDGGGSGGGGGGGAGGCGGRGSWGGSPSSAGDTRMSIGLSGTGLRPVGMFGDGNDGNHEEDEEDSKGQPRKSSSSYTRTSHLNGERYLGQSGGFVFLTRDKPATHALLQQVVVALVVVVVICRHLSSFVILLVILLRPLLLL
jgi:hypothetical protein